MTTAVRISSLRSALFGLSLVAMLTSAGAARADVQACVNAHGDGQLRRDESNFTAAHELFQSCTKPDCPEPIRVECAEFLARLEELTPTVLVSAVDSRGADVTDATVELDGVRFLEGLTGRASPVNPGKHTFVFRRPDGSETETQVLVVEGSKGRPVVGRFPGPKAAARPAEPPPSADAAPGSSRRTLAYVLGGAGVAALATFGYFALSGSSRESELEKSCKPHCTEAEARSVKTKYLVADVSLLVGAGLLGAGTYLYVSAPDDPKQGMSGFAVGYAGRF
jgi:hypothetical protein